MTDKKDSKNSWEHFLPTTLVAVELFRRSLSEFRILQLSDVHKQALIDDVGSRCVRWSTQFGVTFIGWLRIPNLYEREKHSRYEPAKMKC